MVVRIGGESGRTGHRSAKGEGREAPQAARTRRRLSLRLAGMCVAAESLPGKGEFCWTLTQVKHS